MQRPIVFLFSFAAVGCGITGPHNLTLHVQGTVTEASTGQPVAGATVHLFPPTIIFGTSDGDIATATTDAQGHYTLSYRVSDTCLGNGFGYAVSATTSNPVEKADAATVNCSDAPQTLNFALSAVTQ